MSPHYPLSTLFPYTTLFRSPLLLLAGEDQSFAARREETGAVPQLARSNGRTRRGGQLTHYQREALRQKAVCGEQRLADGNVEAQAAGVSPQECGVEQIAVLGEHLAGRVARLKVKWESSIPGAERQRSGRRGARKRLREKGEKTEVNGIFRSVVRPGEPQPREFRLVPRVDLFV